MNLIKHADMIMNNADRIKCDELMREYGLKCSEFLFGHGWHMSDVPKEQWFVFITPEDLDYIVRIATTVQIRPPVNDSRNEYEKTWHIATTNTYCVNTYKEVKEVGAYVNRPTGIWALTGKDVAMYLSRHDYDSLLVMSSAAIPGLLKNIPMTISLQLNGLFVIPDGEYLTIKYYHDKDNFPAVTFWNRQIQENALKYKNEHYAFPHIISVSDLNF